MKTLIWKKLYWMFNQAQCVITLFSQTFLKIDVYESPEETENLVKRFVSETLQIVENIDLYVAHRLRPRPDKKLYILIL